MSFARDLGWQVAECGECHDGEGDHEGIAAAEGVVHVEGVEWQFEADDMWPALPKSPSTMQPEAMSFP